ncbi:MAG: hypothetical protein V2J65_21330, partial [Desulfobacteraceae bacterium]|nr:hypothetical protein [Desulfobacteraceae bacterium]
MKYRLTFNKCKEVLLWGLLAALIPVFVGSALAASGHDDKSMSGHGDKPMSNHDDKSMDPQDKSGAFKHDMMMEGVEAEFQIMSLKSMNMKDPGGATHHVMVKFVNADSGEQLKKAAGKIKVISPSKKEAVADLKDYGGTYAANMTFDEPGKYGVICLVKIDDK